MDTTTSPNVKNRRLRAQHRSEAAADAWAIAQLESLARSECSRMRSALEPNEAVARATLRILEYDRETWHALRTADDPASLDQARKRARMTLRSVISHAAEATTVDRIASRRGANDEQRDAVRAAIEHDGRSPINPDPVRAMAADHDETWPAIRERSTDHQVRMVREQSLESMLADEMRPTPDRLIDHDAPVDRYWRARWQEAARNALRADLISGRRGSHGAALRDAVRRCERMSDTDRATRQRELDAVAVAAIAAADEMSTAVTAMPTDTASQRDERKRANGALVECQRRAEHAASVAAIWRSVDGPWTLLSVLLAACTVADSHDAYGAADGRSESSTIPWRDVAAAIGFSQDRNALAKLRETVRDAIGDMAVTDGALRERHATVAANRAGMLPASSDRTDRLIAAVATGAAAWCQDDERAAYVADARSRAAATFREVRRSQHLIGTR